MMVYALIGYLAFGVTTTGYHAWDYRYHTTPAPTWGSIIRTKWWRMLLQSVAWGVYVLAAGLMEYLDL